MDLFKHVRRVTKLLEVGFPGAAVEELEENVASMSQESRQLLSRHSGHLPFELSLSDLTEQRRRRLFWISWGLRPRSDVHMEESSDLTRVRLRPAARLPQASWLRRGWRRVSMAKDFPTLTRPQATAQPRWKTPGVDTASASALRRWTADCHRRPPLHYEADLLLERPAGSARPSGSVPIRQDAGKGVRAVSRSSRAAPASPKVERRLKDINEDEALHGFRKDHTRPCY